MGNTEQNSIAFKDWYNTLPANIQVAKRNEICEKCEWSISAFYKKINGISTLKNPEKLVVNSIAGMQLDYDLIAANNFNLTK